MLMCTLNPQEGYLVQFPKLTCHFFSIPRRALQNAELDKTLASLLRKKVEID